MANEKTYPNYLMHYRTKGSKNGISTTKGYTAVGQKARGRWINGHYVYEDGAKNNWQQRGNTARGMTARRKAKNTNGRYIDDEYSKNLEYNSKKNGFSKKPRPSANLKGALNNWQQQGNTFRAANEAWERFGSGKSRGITGTDQKSHYGGFGTQASLEGSTRAMNAVSGLGKLRREKKNLSLYGSGDTKTRNSRSDIANAFADAKADAKNAFKTMKQKALLNIVNKWSTGIRKDKKKKKSLKDFFK